MEGREALLLRAFRRGGGDADPGGKLELGPGDDAAVLRLRPGERRLVWTADDLVEGTHFTRRVLGTAALARRLLRVNLSDLAAMGDVRPLAATVTAGLPPAFPLREALKLHRALVSEGRRFGVALAGGNLARSPFLYLSMSLLGSARRIVTRSGAGPGDLVGGVGSLGEAAAGLEDLRGGRKGPFAERWLKPEPKLREGRVLADFATSLMDNSDGLHRSAEILAEASGVRIRLDLAEDLASPALALWCRKRGRDWKEHLLSSGEDYGLVFTVPPSRWSRMKRLLPGAYPLGSVEGGRGVSSPARSRPFEHFP